MGIIDGHVLLEAADSYMVISKWREADEAGHADEFDFEAFFAATRFEAYVSGFYGEYTAFDITLIEGGACEPRGEGLNADLHSATHRFLSHGAIYGLELTSGEIGAQYRRRADSAQEEIAEALSPQEFLDLPAYFLVYLASIWR